MRTIQVVNVRWYNATAWYGVTLAHCLQKAGHESIVAGLEGTPPLEKAKEMEQLILDVKSEGDTIGGTITCVIKGCPAGLGEPALGRILKR